MTLFVNANIREVKSREGEEFNSDTFVPSIARIGGSVLNIMVLACNGYFDLNNKRLNQ